VEFRKPPSAVHSVSPQPVSPAELSRNGGRVHQGAWLEAVAPGGDCHHRAGTEQTSDIEAAADHPCGLRLPFTRLSLLLN